MTHSRSSTTPKNNARTDRVAMTIRGTGGVDPSFKRDIRDHLPARLNEIHSRLERINVRFGESDSGGFDCRIDVATGGSDSAAVGSGRGISMKAAYGNAVRQLERAAAKNRHKNDQDENVIGRREGHGTDAIGRAIAKRRSPARHADDMSSKATRRDAGRGSTAARNVKKNMAGMTAMLEDSQKDRPSRKSTRRSANRIKAATSIQKTVQMKVVGPKATALRSQAKSVASRGTPSRRARG